jgi:hypothetical protein
VVEKQTPNNFELEPLTRTQVLIAMGGTAIILLAIAKAWLHFSRVTLLPVNFTWISLGLGLGVGLIITVASFFNV